MSNYKAWILLFCFVVGEIKCLSKTELYPFGTDLDSQLPCDMDDISSLEFQLKVPIVFYGTDYQSIFVNDNGLLSFLTEVPRFFNAQFPLTYPIIAPLYSDVDTRGTGRIFYRESQAPDLLDRATKDIHRYFSSSSNFQAQTLFISTWDAVGHFDQVTGLTNTFQVVIASNGEDSYIFFLYPEGGIEWIQGNGKYHNLPDARAQAGFMSGDGRLYTLRGSGTDQAKNFDRMSNIRQPGVWMFHAGRTGTNGNVLPADLDQISSVVEKQTCATTFLPCPPTSSCFDYEQGFCCKCLDTHFGNGQNCLLKDVAQRLNGKINGVLNDFHFKDIDLHSYVVTADGRTYTAVSQVPPSIGYDMQTLTVLGGIIGWLFAKPESGVNNGFMLTGGAFNRTAEVKFPQTGHHVFVKEEFLGPDVFNYMKMNIELRGSLPSISSESKIEIDKYEEEYTRVSNGVIRSHSSRSYRLEGNFLEVPFTIDQTITYHACEYELKDPNLDTLRLKVDRNFIVYDSAEEIVRYAMTNEILPYTTEDPCKDGKQKCSENSNCVVDGTRFLCVCNLGYEYLYEDNVNGESATCIDINECATGKDNCHNQAECLNMPGSFFCRCLYGYIGNGVECKKLDTCEDLNCDINANCIQLHNQSFTCVCNFGYHGNGYTCQPDTHPGGSGCLSSADCHPNANCVIDHEHNIYRCECIEGFIGNGIICIEDRDSCNIVQNCHQDATCLYNSSTNNYFCKCNQGFTGDGRHYCYSEDCNLLNTCHPHAQCVYTSTGEFKCQCNAGYVGDGYQCTESYEVSCDQVDICSLDATCMYDVFVSKYVCQCKEGFDGDGVSCRAIDECNTVDNCDRNAQCVYDSGSEKYRCLCNSEYVGDGKRCTLREGTTCDVLNNCGPNAQCNYDHSEQRYKCHCIPGFQGDGFICHQSPVSCNIVNTCSNDAVCQYDTTVEEYRCLCNHGYEGDGHTCTPLRRSCYTDRFLCDYNAECIHESTGYNCRCKDGFIGDGLTCIAVPRQEAEFLVFTQGMSLLQMPFNPTKYDTGKLLLMEAQQTALGIDIDCKNSYIYWTDISHRVIRRVKYDGSGSEIIFTKNLKSPEGIAVDWASRNFYWTDSIKDTIEVATLDGAYHKTLFDSELVNPRGIAIHPGWGKLYWTDWNRNDPKIETSNMDGTGRNILISTNLGLPNMITIDIPGNNLCWTDAGLHHIECSNLDGHQRRVIYTPAAYPFDLTIANRNIYWTDWEIKFVQKVDINGGIAEPLEIPLGGNGKLYGITAISSQCLPVTNPCSVDNGGCHYLCLPNGRGGHTCACPDDADADIDPECNAI